MEILGINESNKNSVSSLLTKNSDLVSQAVHAVASKTLGECDPVRAAIKACIAAELAGKRKINTLLTVDCEKHTKLVDSLQDLQAELMVLPDQNSHDLSDKAQRMMSDLKARGADVWSGGTKVSKEQLSEIKSRISSQVDKHRTAVQNLMTNEIQPLWHLIQPILTAAQNMHKRDDESKKHCLERMR